MRKFAPELHILPPAGHQKLAHLVRPSVLTVQPSVRQVRSPSGGCTTGSAAHTCGRARARRQQPAQVGSLAGGRPGRRLGAPSEGKRRELSLLLAAAVCGPTGWRLIFTSRPASISVVENCNNSIERRANAPLESLRQRRASPVRFVGLSGVARSRNNHDFSSSSRLGLRPLLESRAPSAESDTHEAGEKRESSCAI